jgi:Contractile injection system tube protein/LysM domain
MKLEKLTIYVEKQPFTPVEVLINPNQLAITKTGWKSTENGLVPAVDEPDTLSVDLFFDTSLPQPTASSLGRSVVMGMVGRSALLPGLGRSQDVRKYTDLIVELTTPRGDLGKKPRPPICQLCWGNPKKPFFQGVLKSVTQTLTRFLEDGTPVRATLGCAFEEWEEDEYKQKAQNPVDDPIRIVRRGETLSSIATEEYGDPALWRVIAAENRLDDPRQLTAGQRLTVPPLRLNNASQRS